MAAPQPPSAPQPDPKDSAIITPTTSRSSNESARSPPTRNPSLRLGSMPSAASRDRQSFSESLRGVPPSPRSQRQPSLTQAAVQELIDNPPSRNAADPAFQGRDWRSISVAELVSPEDLRFVEIDTGIEAATNLLLDSSAPFLLIRETSDSTAAIGTFDYTDLNAYLLLNVGLAQPDEEHVSSFQELVKKAKQGSKIPLKDVKDLGRKEPIITLPHTANLMKATEQFGGGHHRIIVVKEGTQKVVGVLSQSRLVRFLWENGRSFPVIDQLYPQYLRDLRIGSQNVISINGDKPLTDALEIMNNEGVNSLAVLDTQHNVIGNISAVDVKLLTKSSALPLLRNSCIHFISVILSTRGMNEGKDSFPVFHVNPLSTLAHTVAKLVATKAHRMWITDPSPSPSSSGPPTPSTHPAHLSVSGPTSIVPPPILTTSPPSVEPTDTQAVLTAPAMSPSLLTSPPTSTYNTPHLPSPSTHHHGSISASSVPHAGGHMSGRLVGVVSLTDVLNLYAKASGLNPGDPEETRKARRRSSSSSVRKSLDGLGLRERVGSREGLRGP